MQLGYPGRHRLGLKACSAPMVEQRAQVEPETPLLEAVPDDLHVLHHVVSGVDEEAGDDAVKVVGPLRASVHLLQQGGGRRQGPGEAQGSGEVGLGIDREKSEAGWGQV